MSSENKTNNIHPQLAQKSRLVIALFDERSQDSIQVEQTITPSIQESNSKTSNVIKILNVNYPSVQEKGETIQIKKHQDAQNGGNCKYEFTGDEVAQKEGYLSDGDNPSSISYGDEDQEDDDFSEDNQANHISQSNNFGQNASVQDSIAEQGTKQQIHLNQYEKNLPNLQEAPHSGIHQSNHVVIKNQKVYEEQPLLSSTQMQIKEQPVFQPSSVRISINQGPVDDSAKKRTYSLAFQGQQQQDIITDNTHPQSAADNHHNNSINQQHIQQQQYSTSNNIVIGTNNTEQSMMNHINSSQPVPAATTIRLNLGSSLGNTQPQQLQLQHPLQPPEQLQKQLDVPQNNGTIIVPIQQNQDLQKRVKIVHQEPSQQIHVQQQVLPPINQQQVIIKQQQTTPTIKVPLSPAPQVQQSHISYADQPASSNFALALVPPPQLSAQQRYDDLFKHACNDGLYYSRQIASIRIQNRQHFSLENMKKVQERSQLHQNHNSFLHSNYQPGLTFLNYSNTLSAQILQKQTNGNSNNSHAKSGMGRGLFNGRPVTQASFQHQNSNVQHHNSTMNQTSGNQPTHQRQQQTISHFLGGPSGFQVPGVRLPFGISHANRESTHNEALDRNEDSRMISEKGGINDQDSPQKLRSMGLNLNGGPSDNDKLNANNIDQSSVQGANDMNQNDSNQTGQGANNANSNDGTNFVCISCRRGHPYTKKYAKNQCQTCYKKTKKYQKDSEDYYAINQMVSQHHQVPNHSMHSQGGMNGYYQQYMGMSGPGSMHYGGDHHMSMMNGHYKNPYMNGHAMGGQRASTSIDHHQMSVSKMRRMSGEDHELNQQDLAQ